ncbi:hypothetical protein MKW92_013585 [Papaver armeniacum]|nr:hypothetical protein MKW92_013585 [Papaver armeniacum]
MSTISFVALQCYECSTMQVKQKKKSNNKWNCVVCNEKQSVRKVFYEAFVAKDVRLFVQNFNMSRQFNDQNNKQTLIEAAVGSYDNKSSQGNGTGCLGKRRNDWSEYLEPEIETSEDGQEKDNLFVLEPEFVTELPKEIFKRPKLKNHSLGLRRSGAVKSSNPVSSSEKTGFPISTKGSTRLPSNEVTYKDIFEKNVSKPKMTFQTETTNLRSSKVTYNELFEKNKPEITIQAETAKGASKWAEYLTEEDEEDNDYLFKGKDEKSTENPFQNRRENLLEMQYNDQKVEEDLHPDFY